MEKTMIPLTEVYKIADKMARPWHWAAGVLAITVAGLLLYLIMAKTISATHQLNTKNTPTLVAIPLPPLNLNITGKICPKTTLKPAIYIAISALQPST